MIQLTTLHKNLFIIAMIISFSMIFFNESGSIGVASPQIQRALNLSIVDSHWIMNAFLLTAALLLLLGGKLADHYGCRKVFIIGIIVFAIASVFCACAQNGTILIGARVMQAMGASLIYPSGGALLSLHFSKKTFTKVYGTVIGIAYLFIAFGPLLGGMLTEFLTWRWLFWVNIGFCLVCLCLTLRAIPKDIKRKDQLRLDLKGLSFLIIGLGAFVITLMQASSWGWSSSLTLTLFTLSVLFLFAFIITEATAKDPLLPVLLFRDPTFLAGNLIYALVASCFAALVFWAFWLQQTFHFSAVTAGIAMIPATVISLFMLRISGNWGDRVGSRKPMLVGAWLLVMALAWIAISANRQSYPWFFFGLLCFGFATPLIIPNTIAAIMDSVEPDLRASVAGVYLTLQHVALSLGFAMLSAITTTVDGHNLKRLLQSTPAYANLTIQQVHNLLLGKTLIVPLTMTQMLSLKQAATLTYTHAFSCAMFALSLLQLIVLGLTLRFIPRKAG